MERVERKAKLIAKNLKFAIVVSRFNKTITDKLIEGAFDCLEKHEADSCTVYWVPGAFEIPGVAKEIAESKRYDAVICLGAIIRGDTSHFDYVATEVSKGIAKIHYDTGIPVIFGVITADTIEQAIERAGTKVGNKGWDAALSAIELINLKKLYETT